MSSVHDGLARFSVWLWPTLADHLWQATILTLLVLLATLLLNSGPARVRYALWLVASAKFIVPSALFALLARLAGFDVAALFGAESTKAMLIFQQLAEPLSMLGEKYRITVDAVSAQHTEIYCALTLVWLAGSLALLTAWLWRRRLSAHSLKEARRVFEGREYDALERACIRLRRKTPTTLLIARHKIEPGVWGIVRPVVVLPEEMTEHLSEEELETVLLHELTHIERRDNFFGHMHAALCCVFWFHPLVWLINYRMLGEREQACDEKVLELGGAPEVYASSILKVVRFCNGWRMGVASGAAGSNLQRRIRNIMNGNTKRKFAAWQRALCGVVGAMAIILSIAAGLFGFSRTDNASAQAAEAQNTSAQQAAREPSGESSKRASKRVAQDEIAGGKVISVPKPVYPPEAKEKGIAGTVEVEIEINEEGKVTSARATVGPMELRASSEEAARKALFEPAMVKNKPVKVAASLSFKFSLDEKKDN